LDRTKFACPTRSTGQEIDQATQAIVRSEVFTKILNLYPEIVLILDRNRQAVFCNNELLRNLGLNAPEKILGKRPGEIFNCVNASRE
jgi:transcriptional regulator with PAS, ATPase and Fis domain